MELQRNGSIEIFRKQELWDLGHDLAAGERKAGVKDDSQVYDFGNWMDTEIRNIDGRAACIIVLGHTEFKL